MIDLSPNCRAFYQCNHVSVSLSLSSGQLILVQINGLQYSWCHGTKKSFPHNWTFVIRIYISHLAYPFKKPIMQSCGVVFVVSLIKSVIEQASDRRNGAPKLSFDVTVIWITSEEYPRNTARASSTFQRMICEMDFPIEKVPSLEIWDAYMRRPHVTSLLF